MEGVVAWPLPLPPQENAVYGYMNRGFYFLFGDLGGLFPSVCYAREKITMTAGIIRQSVYLENQLSS